MNCLSWGRDHHNKPFFLEIWVIPVALVLLRNFDIQCVQGIIINGLLNFLTFEVYLSSRFETAAPVRYVAHPSGRSKGKVRLQWETFDLASVCDSIVHVLKSFDNS